MKIVIFLLFILTNYSFANSIFTSSVYKIDYPDIPNEDTLLLLLNGRVIKVPPLEMKIRLPEIQLTRSYIFEVDELRYLQAMSPNTTDANDHSKMSEVNINTSFKPTTLTSYNEAARIFKSFKKKSKKDSQCYNRSHVWAYESQKLFGISSMKAFLFFTRSYIRDFNFEWWFHNAPMTYLYSNAQTKELILDPEFTSHPLEMKEWTDVFMKNKVKCDEISRYSDYELNQESTYCYVLRESMFFYQPLDLERLEKEGHSKKNWVDWEVKNAFLQGFGI